MQRGEASAFDPAFYWAAIGGVRRPSEGAPFWRSPSGAQVAEAVSVRPVLLVIDILVDFLDRWSEADRAKLVASVRSLVELFRAMGLPVVWVSLRYMDGGIARVMSLSEVAACLAGRKAQS
jgi:hypothetical protein